MIYEIKSDLLTVQINDAGAELFSVKDSDGHEYIWQGDERYWKDRAPLLFPTCGRLLENKFVYGGKEYAMRSHGFAKRCVFEVVSKEAAKITLKLSQNELTLSEYPFNFELYAEYEVSDDKLDARFTVKNTDEKILPYMFGWHPGFTLDGDGGIGRFTLDFDGKTNLVWHPLQNGPFVNPNGKDYAIDGKYALCEKEIYENDTMIFVGTGDKTRLTSPDTKYAVEFAWSENLPYFCIWKDDNSDARFICLEPWSGVPADGITPENFETRKMSRLESGKSESYTYSVKFC